MPAFLTSATKSARVFTNAALSDALAVPLGTDRSICTSRRLSLTRATLALVFSGLWCRLIRSRVRETLQFGAAQGARARGIPEWKVTLKYGLAPASGALLAFLGTQAGGLLAGAFVVETIFDWPGMGSLLIESVLRRDYPVVEGAVFLAAFASLAGSALGDWLQASLDPRSRDS